MRQIAIDSTAPGMITGRHIYPPGESGGVPLLAAQVVITEVILQRLRKSGINVIMIDDELSAGIDNIPPITDDTRRAAITVLGETFQMMGRSDAQLDAEQVKSVENVIARIMTEIASRRNLLVCLSDLNLFGGERMQHALNVCVVGSAIAKVFFKVHGWRDFRGQRREDGIEDRLVKLGMGLLLQDIGMLSVPESIREKRGILSADERAIMQQHPLLGLELLEGSEVSPLTKVAVAQHHERHDGSGYPRGISGDELHDHGQIAGIAETYVSLCFDEADNSAPMQPHEAYTLLLRARGRLFRPEIVDAFAAAIAPYGSGTTIRLSDDSYGIVVGNHAAAPLTPAVRVTHDAQGNLLHPPREYDLRTTPGLTIAGLASALPGDAETARANS